MSRFLAVPVLRPLVLLPLLALPLCARAAPPVEALYARSNGDLAENERPGKYVGLNVLDGKPGTVWCSAGTGQDATLEVQFLRSVTIEKLEVASGHQAGGQFKAFGRPRRIEVIEGDMAHPMELADRAGRQTLEFDPPLSSDRLIFKFKSGYRGEHRHICIADLVFLHGNKPLNGAKQNPIGKGGAEKRPLLDAWTSGPAYARNRELVLGLGDTYRFSYLPSEDSDAPVQKTGPWRIEGGAVQLKDGKEWVLVELEKDDAGRVEKLRIEAEPFTGTYARRTPGHFH